MDRRKPLKQLVVRAKRSLNIEKSIPRLQYGLLIAVVVYTAILLSSRLFIFPYYNNVALVSSLSILVVTFGFIWWARVKYKEALTQLDRFYPHNELITALSFTDETNPLVNSILKSTEKVSEESFNRFKKRKKRLFRPKTTIASLLLIIISGTLYIFPSSTQQEAVAIEKENKITDELKKEVAELEKKTANDEVKKELQELQNKLKEIDRSEEALREVVKKQKELKLQKENLEKKKELVSKGEDGVEGLTAEEEERLKELVELQKTLAESASDTQTALGKLGKSISFDLQNAIAQESAVRTPSDVEGGESGQGDSSQSDSTEQQGKGQNNNNQGNNSSQGQGNNGSQGQGSGPGQGNGTGSGQGQGNGNGAGGQGSGTGGTSGGFGQGSKNLLSIPERFGENSDVIVDGGPLGEGSPLGEQEGPVPVTKGSVQPYEEVIGQYKDRYMESSERMQLPKDLQSIVQSYFSSIESE